MATAEKILVERVSQQACRFALGEVTGTFQPTKENWMTPLQIGKWSLGAFGPWQCLRDLSRSLQTRAAVRELHRAGGGTVIERRRDGSTLEVRVPGRDRAPRCRCAHARQRPVQWRPASRRSCVGSRGRGR
jgi:hypothetical protein